MVNIFMGRIRRRDVSLELYRMKAGPTITTPAAVGAAAVVDRQLRLTEVKSRDVIVRLNGNFADKRLYENGKLLKRSFRSMKEILSKLALMRVFA